MCCASPNLVRVVCGSARGMPAFRTHARQRMAAMESARSQALQVFDLTIDQRALDLVQINPSPIALSIRNIRTISPIQERNFKLIANINSKWHLNNSMRLARSISTAYIGDPTQLVQPYGHNEKHPLDFKTDRDLDYESILSQTSIAGPRWRSVTIVLYGPRYLC